MSAPTLCVAALLTDGDKVALIRSGKPGRAWELPGGGVKPGETWRQAMSREVEEETGIFVPPTWWTVVDVLNGEPTPGADYPSVIIVARVKTIAGLPLRAGSDAIEAAWFRRGALHEHLSPLKSRDALLTWNAERKPIGVTAEELQEVEAVPLTWPAEREGLTRIAAARPGVFRRMATTIRAQGAEIADLRGACARHEARCEALQAELTRVRAHVATRHASRDGHCAGPNCENAAAGITCSAACSDNLTEWLRCARARLHNGDPQRAEMAVTDGVDGRE